MINNNNLGTLENEIWKDVRGYEEYYQISSLGRLKSLERIELTSQYGHEFYRPRHLKILKPGLNTCGYLQATLCKNGIVRMTRIHRLVGENFLENPNNFDRINHKNGIKIDNRVENLEWCNRSHDRRHALDTGLVDLSKIQGSNHWNHILTEKDIIFIRTSWKNGQYSRKELAKMFNVCKSNIAYIINYKIWKHVK